MSRSQREVTTVKIP